LENFYNEDYESMTYSDKTKEKEELKEPELKTILHKRNKKELDK